MKSTKELLSAHCIASSTTNSMDFSHTTKVQDERREEEKSEERKRERGRRVREEAKN